jgi:hypothetical protein
LAEVVAEQQVLGNVGWMYQLAVGHALWRAQRNGIDLLLCAHGGLGGE